VSTANTKTLLPVQVKRLELKPGKTVRVLVASEHHGDDRLILATTEEQLHRAAIALVKERSNPNYCSYADLLDVGDMDTSANLTDEEIAALPNESLRNQARKEKQEFLGRAVEHRRELAMKELLDKALTGDGQAAWKLLESRSRLGYDDESVELRYLEEA
jgi:hypothetical protein